MLNNELTDFSFAPADAQGRPVANRVQPGKRPRSSMAPTLVFDKATNQLVMSGGSPGGALIIHFTAKTLYGVLNWGLNASAGHQPAQLRLAERSQPAGGKAFPAGHGGGAAGARRRSARAGADERPAGDHSRRGTRHASVAGRRRSAPRRRGDGRLRRGQPLFPFAADWPAGLAAAGRCARIPRSPARPATARSRRSPG